MKAVVGFTIFDAGSYYGRKFLVKVDHYHEGLPVVIYEEVDHAVWLMGAWAMSHSTNIVAHEPTYDRYKDGGEYYNSWWLKRNLQCMPTLIS